MKKNRVAILSNTFWSIYNFRQKLIDAIIEEGYEVYIMAPYDEYYEYLKKKYATVIVLKTLKSKSFNVLNDFKLICELHNIVKKYKFDYALCYTIKPNIYFNVSLIFNRNVIIINTINGLGHLFIKRTFLSYIGFLLYKIALVRSNFVVFQNVDDEKLFVDLRLVQKRKVQVISGSGVDTNKFDLGYLDHNRVENILFVGRLIKEKGILEFVESAKKIKEVYPYLNVHIVGGFGLGNPSELNRDDFNKLISDYDFHYYDHTDDIKKFFNKDTIIVLPSYREGLPKTLLEAASCRIPIIATNVPGCRDVVIDGINGFLCNAMDSIDLTKVLCKVLSLDSKSLITLGENGRERVLQRFSDDIVIDRYLLLLKRKNEEI